MPINSDNENDCGGVMQLTIENGELKIKIEYDCRGAALLRLLLAVLGELADNILFPRDDFIEIFSWQQAIAQQYRLPSI